MNGSKQRDLDAKTMEKQTCLGNATPPYGEHSWKEDEIRGAETYMAREMSELIYTYHKTKRATAVGLLAEVYTSELGPLYMEDPSWLAWHNSTVPTRERKRQRKRWCLVWGQHTTSEKHGNTNKKGREM